MDDAFATLLAFIACIFLFPWLVMICWNAVIPTTFGLTVITYKQAFILYWLCRLLFKNSNSGLKD